MTAIIRTLIFSFIGTAAKRMNQPTIVVEENFIAQLIVVDVFFFPIFFFLVYKQLLLNENYPKQKNER